MTWTLTSSPLAVAAWAPASTAARTEPTSPRTKVVTYAPPICTWPARDTLAALHIASVAAMVAIRPLVSTRPRASWLPFRRLLLLAMRVFPRFGGGGSADARGLGRVFLARDGQHRAEVFGRPRVDLHAADLAGAAGRRGAGIARGLARGHVADDHRGHQAAADLLPADQGHVRGLQHGVARFDQRHQALGLDHAKGFHGRASHRYLQLSVISDQ